MLSRMSLAVGALGLGALAFVGTGSFASYTGTVNTSAHITSGTFALSAATGTPTVNQSNGQSLDAGTLGGNHSSTLTYTVTNADPGHTYTIPFTVYDVGSLPGEVNSISYSPISGPIASDFTISICHVEGSTCDAISTPNVQPGPKSVVNGGAAATFSTISGGGSGLTDFIGSNPSYGSNGTGGGAASQSYKIVETFNSSNNADQGKSEAQTFTVNGINQ